MDLMKNENLLPEDIDGIVFVSQTPDYMLPATSIILQDRLKLSKETMCLDLHNHFKDELIFFLCSSIDCLGNHHNGLS